MNLDLHYDQIYSQIKAYYSLFGWDKEEDFFQISSNIYEWMGSVQEANAMKERLFGLLGDVKKAVLMSDERAYVHLIERAQASAIALFEAYVKYYMKPWRDEYKDTRGKICNTTVDEDFIAQHGYRWFKFFDKVVTMKMRIGDEDVNFKIIPRYADKYTQNLDGYFYLDADEMLIAKKLGKEGFDHIRKAKEKSVLYKIFIGEGGKISAKPVSTFNGIDVVRDWTLRLFTFGGI